MALRLSSREDESRGIDGYLDGRPVSVKPSTYKTMDALSETINAPGLGVPRKIVRGMREHNGTEPDLIEEEERFTVRLWKERASDNVVKVAQ